MDPVGDKVDEIRKNINLLINFDPTNINTGVDPVGDKAGLALETFGRVDEIRKHIIAMKSWTSDKIRKYDIALMLLTDEEKAKYGKNIVAIAYDILTNINDLPNSQI